MGFSLYISAEASADCMYWFQSSDYYIHVHVAVICNK